MPTVYIYIHWLAFTSILCVDYHSEQGKRLKAAEDTFGTNPLPKLERFTFKVGLFINLWAVYTSLLMTIILNVPIIICPLHEYIVNNIVLEFC